MNVILAEIFGRRTDRELDCFIDFWNQTFIFSAAFATKALKDNPTKMSNSNLVLMVIAIVYKLLFSCNPAVACYAVIDVKL